MRYRNERILVYMTSSMFTLTASDAGLKTDNMAGLPSHAKAPPNPLSTGYVIAAIVLGSLCIVFGAIYGYIHFTKIHPRSNRPRFLADAVQKQDMHGASGATHIFLVRNPRAVQAM